MLRLADEPSEAMRHYRRAIDLQPDLALAHFNLGYLLLKSGDFASGWREC